MSGRVAAAGEGAAEIAARSRWQQALIGWSFAAPFVVLFAIFMAGPVLASLVMAFTDLRISDIRNPLGVDFVGVDNFVQLFGDGKFWTTVVNTLYFVVVGIPLTMIAGLAAAVGLNQEIVKFRSVFRVGYYLPVVTSIVAIAVVWRLLLSDESGLVNGLLGTLGIHGPDWLNDPVLAMPSLIVMAAWRNLGFQMVIFLAGLQTIPQDLYEAADLDGAGRWAQFRGITLPLLRPTLLFSAVITSIGYLQFFEEPFVMTNGGPLNSTISMSMYTYKQFGFGNYGYAASMSYIIFVVIAIVAAIQFRLLRDNT